MSGTAFRAEGRAEAGATSDPLHRDGASEKNSVTSRALALSTYFLSGVLSINLSQFLGTPLRLLNEDWYNAWIAFTKQSFGLLTMALTEAFAPTTVVISGDASVRGQMYRGANGTLQVTFPERLVMIANHQIYTDWLYLWWIAYCNKMHGYLYIVLKESLKNIPILGWGMQLSQFIFLKRNWEQDKPHMAEALQRLNKSKDPMWLLLFPEGTNLAPDTRLRSSVWARKSGVKDCQHVLLPRSTGLQFCLNELQRTVDYLYDCTVAYEGVPRGQYAQDIFTLKAGYLQGRPPKSIGMYWRRFAVKHIPVHDEKAFGLWLLARWREKDLLIENYHRFGRFPSDVGASKTPQGMILRGCGLLDVRIKPSHWYEFLQIFAPMGVLAMVLYIFYGALPQSMWNSINEEVIRTSTNEFKQIKQWTGDASVRGVSGSLDMDSFFDKSQQDKTFHRIGMDLLNRLQTPEAKAVINRASLVQRWLEDPQKFISDNFEERLPPKRTFIQQLQEEEKKRQGTKVRPHQGTFWRDMEALAATRRCNSQLLSPTNANNNSSSISDGVSGKAELQKRSSNKHEAGTFWDDLKSEDNIRRGSVIGSCSLSAARRPNLSIKGCGSPQSQPPKLQEKFTSNDHAKRRVQHTQKTISKATTRKPSVHDRQKSAIRCPATSKTDEVSEPARRSKDISTARASRDKTVEPASISLSESFRSKKPPKLKSVMSRPS